MTTRPESGNRLNKPAAVCLLALAVALGGGAAWAQSSVSSGTAASGAGTLSHDCTQVTVDYADEPGLTREERIARMDRAFQRSLSRFEECQSQRAGTGGGTGDGAGGAGAGGGTGNGTGDGELRGTEAAGTDAAGSESDGAETSTAASDISGPDAPLDARSAEGASTAASDVTGNEPAVTASTTSSNPPNPNSKWTRPDDPARDVEVEDSPPGDEPVREAARTQGGGKLPEDIPPADNDSALEAQIRQAAIEETDPELKKRLWDEYRRYKGLPVPN